MRQIIEFATVDPTATGEQTITYTSHDTGGCIDVEAVRDGLPDAIA
ncbi:hypothetical protein [Nocardia sp. NPDC057455]